MTNTNIQGAIPLQGKGFVVRKKGGYLPGEYKRLANCEIDDRGNIVQRRGIARTGEDGATWEMTNPQGFIGYLGDYAVVASADEQRFVFRDIDNLGWDPQSLPVPSGGWHKLVNCFRYNSKYYWITLEMTPGTGGGADTYRICAYSCPLPTPDPNPKNVTFSSLTRTVLATETIFCPIISNVFIHKDRMWIISNMKVYWSKATDPLVQAVPDGGFLKVPDQEIKYAFALSDTIYILCANQIYGFSYSSDPNDDGYLRLITDSMGAEWGCAHRSTPFIVNKTGIFAVSGLSVDKVFESQMFDVDYGQNKILSFDKYLILVKRDHVTYENDVYTSNFYWYKTGKKFEPGALWNTKTDNVMFINTDTGASHTVDFTDANDIADKTKRGYVVDLMLNPNKDFGGEQRLYFLTNRFVSDVAGVKTYKGSTYFMTGGVGIFVIDGVRNSDLTEKGYKPRYCVEIEGYAPDGSEYMMKKFRNLMMMAKFPKSDFAVQVGFDNQPYRDPVDLPNENFDNMTPYFPARVAINQRARSLNIKLTTINNDTPLPDGVVYDQLEISDVRILWTYTGRGLDQQTQTLANQTP